MTDEIRPIYVGFGTCKCGRIDVKLYQLPNAPPLGPLACSACLEKSGLKEPVPRTAEDIEVVDGKMMWRKT